MDAIWKYTTAILFGVAVFAICLWQISGCNHRKDIATLTQQVNDCRHAPVIIKDTVKYVTIHDTLIKWQKPQETTKFVYIHDTVPPKYCERYFTDSYKYVSGLYVGKIDYEIVSKDCDISVRFPKITLPVEYHSEIKTVDTCLHPLKKSMWEWEINAYPVAYDLINFHWKALAEANVSYWRIKIGIEPEMTIEKTPQFGITAKLGYKFLN